MENGLFDRLEQKGISRRDFMKFCGYITATLGLSAAYVPRVAEVFAAGKQRPAVIWLHMAECTGCSEGVLRSVYPWIDELVLEILAIEYHETIMAAAGRQAEEQLEYALNKYKGKFICVVEGAIPTKDRGIYGRVGSHTMLELGKKVTKKALATITIGNCSSFGGVQAAKPNPTNAKSIDDALGIKSVKVAGCPPNPINFVGTVVNYLLLGKLPATDEHGRPLFAYGKTVHDQCPRRSHYEAGEFVKQFGSEEAAKGWCLYEMGCKGPETYNNCPIVKFNDGTSWPVEAGHPCIGCSEPNFWDQMAPFYEQK